jgi:diphosphomevalonate decarboxylase
VVAVVSREHKAVGSHAGHALARTSPLQGARLAAVPGLLATVRAAIEDRDLSALGDSAEQDALTMHSVMMTSQPSLLYWLPPTLSVMHAVRSWRQAGLATYFTLDAGPNVHCLCEARHASSIGERLRNLPGVLDVLVSGPGEGVRLVEYHLF